MSELADLLVELEEAVDSRRSCPSIERLDAPELRALLYDVVRTYRADPERPAEVFRRLVENVAQAHGASSKELALSVDLRRELLEEIRLSIAPALPALLGPIYIEQIHRVKFQHQWTPHPMVRGVRLIDGERMSPAGAGVRQATGRSWWIVALPQIDENDAIAARYAYTDHRGSVTDEEGGRTSCDVVLATVDEVASQIRDDRFGDMLTGLHQRLLTATSSNTRVAKAIEASSSVLRRCVAAVRRPR